MLFTKGQLSINIYYQIGLSTTVSPTNTNADATLTVKVVSNHTIPQDGYLKLRFNSYWYIFIFINRDTNVVNISQIVSEGTQCFSLKVELIIYYRIHHHC